MSVPFIDLKRFEDGFLDSWQKTVSEMSANTQFMGGPQVAQLEENVAADCQSSHAVGCANGTDALQVALRAVGVGRGDTVLLPDATFWATFEAIVNVGANPITVDINEQDLQMDFDRFVEAAEKHKPKAAMLVHLYGWGTSRLEDYRKYCKDNSIQLIEDGAQAYGVTYKGESLYKDALISTISFYPAKVYGAAGDAGAIITSDEALAKRARSLCNHGRSEHYSYGDVGWNSRLDALQAAYLNLIHPHLKARLESRRTMAAKYRDRLAPLGYDCVPVPEGYVENGYLNCVVVDPANRDDIVATLKDKGIGVGIVYPEPMSIQSGAKPFLAGTVGTEIADRICKSVLSLPLFAYMTEQEFDEVIAAVQSLA